MNAKHSESDPHRNAGEHTGEHDECTEPTSQTRAASADDEPVLNPIEAAIGAYLDFLEGTAPRPSLNELPTPTAAARSV